MIRFVLQKLKTKMVDDLPASGTCLPCGGGFLSANVQGRLAQQDAAGQLS